MEIRGLSQKFVDTTWLYCFLNIIQISSSYYDRIIHEWIKYQRKIDFNHIYTQLLLLWQRGVEVRGARQNYVNYKTEIVSVYVCIILYKRKIVVILSMQAMQTLNTNPRNL